MRYYATTLGNGSTKETAILGEISPWKRLTTIQSFAGIATGCLTRMSFIIAPIAWKNAGLIGGRDGSAMLDLPALFRRSQSECTGLYGILLLLGGVKYAIIMERHH